MVPWAPISLASSTPSSGGVPPSLDSSAPMRTPTMKSLADPRPNRLHHLEQEPRPVLELTPVGIRAGIRQPRQELPQEVRRGQNLAPVQTSFPTTHGGVGKGANDAGDVPCRHLARHRTVRRIADDAGSHGRQPVPRRPAGAPPHVGELAHQTGAVPVHASGEGPEHGDDRVVADVDLAVDRTGVAADVGRPAEHGEPDSAPGLFLVIGLVALSGLAALRVARRVRRRHHAVPEGPAPDGEG